MNRCLPARTGLTPGGIPTARWSAALALAILLLGGSAASALEVGFSASDLTPEVEGPAPVWLAGQESGRKATGIHDRLQARAVVLADGDKKIALVGADLIGIQYPLVQRIRQELADFQYVLVASTHNHEGPDVVGIWGPAPQTSGVDPRYLDRVLGQVVVAVRQADRQRVAATARYAQASDPSLLADYRLPNIFDSVLRTIEFRRLEDNEPCGLIVQWNSHPVEPDGNHLLTRDFMGYAVDSLEARHRCPVVYFSGAVGGLMGTPTARFRDASGKIMAKDVFDFMRLYGEAVADLALLALESAAPIELAPWQLSTRELAVPLDNTGYRQARAAGVLTRPAVVYEGNPEQPGAEVPPTELEGPQAVLSEVAYLRLGQLHLAAIPGELYPELVYGEFPAAPEPGVDFPEAPLEPAVMNALPGPQTMLIGLANDEVGYIIPRRQWDVAAPYAYNRKSPQYGERNSLGPDTARVLLEALVRRVAEVVPAPAPRSDP